MMDGPAICRNYHVIHYQSKNNSIDEEVIKCHHAWNHLGILRLGQSIGGDNRQMKSLSRMGLLPKLFPTLSQSLIIGLC